MNRARYTVGIDIGKTKISAGLFSEDAVLVDYAMKSSGNNAQEILDAVEDLFKLYIEKGKVRITGIGIASFGIVNSSIGRVVSSGVIPDWNNVPIKEHMESRFHIPTFVENDVKAAALGEYCALEQKKSNDSLLYLSIGTSIGFAVVENSSLWHGAHQRFGEIASFRPSRSTLALGELIGGKGIIDQYFRETQCLKTGEELFSLAMSGDSLARNIYEAMIVATAELLKWLDRCFDPEHLLVGGGVICKNKILFHMLQEQYNTLTGETRNVLTAARLHEKSGVYGAAALVWQKTMGVLPIYN